MIGEAVSLLRMGRWQLQREYRLAKRADFSKVYRFGKSAANSQFVVYAMNNGSNLKIRVGVSCSKKLGGAVVRNRIRRRIKEIMRLQMDRIVTRQDIIIIARKPCVELSYKEMERSLMHVLKRASLLHSANKNS